LIGGVNDGKQLTKKAEGNLCSDFIELSVCKYQDLFILTDEELEEFKIFLNRKEQTKFLTQSHHAIYKQADGSIYWMHINEE